MTTKKMLRKKRKRSTMLLPKKKIFRKVLYNFKVRLDVKFRCHGHAALIAKESGILEKREMEHYKFAFRRAFKKSPVRVYVSSVFDKPFTKKSKQARMGKGKAKVRSVFARVDQFDPIFEFRFVRRKLKRKKKKLRKREFLIDKKIFFSTYPSNYNEDPLMNPPSKMLSFILRRRHKKALRRDARLYFKKKRTSRYDRFRSFIQSLFCLDGSSHKNYLIRRIIRSNSRSFVRVSRRFMLKSYSYKVDRNAMLLRVLIYLRLKYRFSLPVIVYPTEFFHLYGGLKNSSLGRR